MKGIWRRFRGALGIGALGAAGFHLIGWGIVAFESLVTGTLPTLAHIARMSAFTIPVGGFVGLLTAGAIMLGAGRTTGITKGRAFLLGLPLGAAGGLAMSLMFGGGLPVASLIVNAVTVAGAAGALGAVAVAVSERAQLPAREAPTELPVG
ncbi:hypothetical protein V3331_10780 [Gaopeijia maritima]|uniref:hypothetical protein n=1 Tax=Gaopeijia maritima TaxID=3119007 RepID=UPI00324A439A